jgi:hypothetical protein
MTVSVEHVDQSASRTQRLHHPASAVVLEDLQKAGAAKAEGAPPLSHAQVDRIVAILRQAGSRSGHLSRKASGKATHSRALFGGVGTSTTSPVTAAGLREVLVRC